MNERLQSVTGFKKGGLARLHLAAFHPADVQSFNRRVLHDLPSEQKLQLSPAVSHPLTSLPCVANGGSHNLHRVSAVIPAHFHVTRF